MNVEAIPALLSHLGIRDIAIGCHSGGTIYALDLLLHHPVLLHPERPYLAIGAPWILPSHTDSTLLSIIQLLPAGIIGMSDKLQKLINNHIGPAIGMTFGVSAVAVSKLQPKRSHQSSKLVLRILLFWKETSTTRSSSVYIKRVYKVPRKIQSSSCTKSTE